MTVWILNPSHFKLWKQGDVEVNYVYDLMFVVYVLMFIFMVVGWGAIMCLLGVCWIHEKWPFISRWQFRLGSLLVVVSLLLWIFFPESSRQLVISKGVSVFVLLFVAVSLWTGLFFKKRRE